MGNVGMFTRYLGLQVYNCGARFDFAIQTSGFFVYLMVCR